MYTKVYITHSTAFNYRQELYQPIRQCEFLQQYEFILPHEFDEQSFNSKDAINNCNLVLAEVSYPSTGQGIELGWANMLQKPVVCIYQEGKQFSSSLRIITEVFAPYTTREEMLRVVEKLLEKLKNEHQLPII